ncbi:hypothetical protein PYW07_005871 [Mythimna separata]|uniref:Uncharacterized protein n=1 Tax=Mythimna separata TaxID=271217 RepID=A0AAD7YKR7_MYTSE|nr:hypothetical protein PYW07_005871 [Mythimna separata]
MSIPLLIYWAITKIMPVVDSASLRKSVFVPLISNVDNESSDGYLSNEMPESILSILRTEVSTEKILNLRQYDGYTFDYSRCIQFNDRILCGYDKNKGTPLDDYTMIDIGNGCRSRGDRIECGYDNPHYQNLRQPVVHGRVSEHDKDSEHNTQHRNNHHHEKNHHFRSLHHHGKKHHVIRARQPPTRTAAITDPTTPSVTINKMETDSDPENKLLKSVSMKAKDMSVESIKTRAKIDEATPTTNTAETSTTTTVKPTESKSTITSRSTRKTPQSTTTKTTTLTTNITTLPKNSESNEISDDETKILRLEPVIKQSRRLLTKLLPTIPKLDSKFKSDRIVHSRILSIGKTGQGKKNGAVLRMETDSAEKKVKTACVEQEDRVVCYDFKT